MVSGIKEVYSGSREYRGGSHSLSAREVRLFRQSSQGRQPELNLEGRVVVQAEGAGNDIPGRKSSRSKSMEERKHLELLKTPVNAAWLEPVLI